MFCPTVLQKFDIPHDLSELKDFIGPWLGGFIVPPPEKTGPSGTAERTRELLGIT